MGNEILHIVERSSRGRAEQCRMVMSLGLHAEPYEGVREFEERPPMGGVVIVRDDDGTEGVRKVAAVMARQGLWLPIVATGEKPDPGRVVEAVEAGVVDYLPLPMQRARLKQALARVERECELHGAERQRVVEARRRLSGLTNRERQVLEQLTEGASNKLIARNLAISPRTVEIHRKNMMTKLGAGHAAGAVRVQLEARLDDAVPLPGGPGAGAGTGRPVPAVGAVERRLAFSEIARSSYLT